MTIQPLNSRIIACPTEAKNHKTETGIELIQNELSEAVVVEVSPDLAEIFKKGDTILYPTGSGQGQLYEGKMCVWLNGLTEIWGIVTVDDIAHPILNGL